MCFLYPYFRFCGSRGADSQKGAILAADIVWEPLNLKQRCHLLTLRFCVNRPVSTDKKFSYCQEQLILMVISESEVAQSCPTPSDPMDCSLPGSPIPGILQARTLEWVAISFSNAWKWKVKVKSLSHVRLLATTWTAAYQAPPSMGFSRQEYRPLKSIKKKRHHFGNKGPYIQSYGFSSSHVWMLELDHTEGWMPKNWSFWTVCGVGRLLRVPWTARRSNQLIWKESPEYSLEGLRLKLKFQYLGHLMQRATSLEKTLTSGKDWRQKGMTEDEMVGWHHRLDGHEFKQTPGDGEGQGSLVCCSPWGHRESDTTEQQNNNMRGQGGCHLRSRRGVILHSDI